MPFTKARILCTEDHPDTRELLVYVLTEQGFDVTCSGSGAEALNLAQTQSFDLYLLDNWLPDVLGSTLTQRIREFDGKTPILFYSGAGYDGDKEAARLAGAQAYLVKPVDVDLLVGEVTRLIAEARIDAMSGIQLNA